MNSKQLLRSAIALMVLILTSACASWMPDDPFMEAKSDKALEVPEGMELPASDPNLAIPAGESVAVIKGGHLPPKPQNPTAIVDEVNDELRPKE